MKLVRFGLAGAEQPGVWLEASADQPRPMILDVRAMAFDIEDFNAHFFSHHGMERLAGLLREPGRKLVPAEGLRLGPPVARPGKIVCLGKNYAEHAREFDATIPKSPILFTKADTALNGPFDNVVLPRGATIVDAEVELAVVIGQRTRQADRKNALASVAGYTVLNDITDRMAQRSDGQWFRGKSTDTFCPLGPYLVTPDAIPNVNRLRLFSRLNETVLQDGNTADMLFKIPFIIEFISATITLEPGDVIATGTPAGIGSARQPPIVLKDGDVMETIVEGVGRQLSRVAAL